MGELSLLSVMNQRGHGWAVSANVGEAPSSESAKERLCSQESLIQSPNDD